MKLFPGVIQSKLPHSNTSVFAVMTKLADENNAVNLSQGFPDFPVSDQLVTLVTRYLQKGYNQYAPMPGVMALREEIARKTYELHSANYNPETEITVTAGATQAIFTAISTFIREEDEVIVFEPAYDSYIPAIRLNGGIPVVSRLKQEDYRIDWEQVRCLMNSRTRMIIINSPHNPTGSILHAEDMAMLEKITRDTGIIILSDEVYEHIIFDGNPHLSVCSFPELAQRSLITCSFGKTFHATGWKTGYCLAPANLMQEFRKTHQFAVFCTNTPVQYAISDFIKEKENYVHLGSFYQKKRDFFIDAIKTSRFKLSPSKGTYFQILDYSDISQDDEMDFARYLVEKHGVAAVPNAFFYNKPFNNKTLRFCFAKTQETLEKAAEILCKI